MSSALKPALTPSGTQNPPVASQLNKPLHTQGAPTTYGQPTSHIPQNLVNIPHGAPTTGSIHNPVLSNTHNVAHHLSSNVHGTTHSGNHYSLNVPNASQHYPISGNVQVNTHSAPVSNHPVSNTTQAHTQPAPTFSPLPKNLSYAPNYQANLGHTYKTPSVTTSQPVQITESAPSGDKPQSNGTPDIKIATKPEPAQNHIVPTSKEKPQLPPPEIQTPSTPENRKTVAEQQTTNVENTKPESPKLEENKPAEIKDDTVPQSTEDDEEEEEEFEISAPVDSTDNSVNAVSSSNENNCSSDLEPATVSTNDESSSQTEPSPTEVPENSESRDDSSLTNTNSNKLKEQSNQKSTVKVATTPRSQPKKPKTIKDAAETPKITKSEAKSTVQKSPGSGGKSKRTRIKTQPYQSPLPEVEMISKISATTPRSKNNEDKLIIFYKNEFLAVRNSEGGFYICQAVQNIYKSSPRIRIRWLSQDKNDKELYTPDFYDNTDFDCILTNLNLSRAGKGKYKLPSAEKIRTDSILKRALDMEKGDAKPTSLTEEHPDGLDLSLYKEESQLKKRKAVKRKANSPIKTARSLSNTSKSPDQPKVQKVSPKPKSPPVKKTTVLKKTLATKAKKNVASNRTERASKRHAEESKNSTKTASVIDQKKAKVLAKVARKTVLPQPKTQPPPKQNNPKATKPTVTLKKPPSTKKLSAAVIRKSKRGKK